ncbi:MAG: NAD(P)H-hydrate epimerase [Actinobacteria bacterium]|nr:NAD(P)H-hydrate epimerase [Actinomycetota bacterium]
MSRQAEWPALTAEQMRAVDRAMVDDFHIDLVQMMENAGRSVAELAIDAFGPIRVVVLAGSGGNGGGGLVAARHLVNRGVELQVVLSHDPERLAPVSAHQLDILRRMEVPVLTASACGDLPGSDEIDLVIDALIGYSLVGNPTGITAELIRWANRQQAPVLSVDTPSGLDVTTGAAADPCISAAVTVTLALPKIGLFGAKQVGKLYLADISVPRLLYHRMGITVGDLFVSDHIPLVCACGPVEVLRPNGVRHQEVVW